MKTKNIPKEKHEYNEIPFENTFKVSIILKIVSGIN